jgi:hypothetical protein
MGQFSVENPGQPGSVLSGTQHVVLLEDGDLAINAEHFGHFGGKVVVAAFQVIADLVWLDLMGGQDFADRALDDARQRRMTGRDGVRTSMTCRSFY